MEESNGRKQWKKAMEEREHIRQRSLGYRTIHSAHGRAGKA